MKTKIFIFLILTSLLTGCGVANVQIENTHLEEESQIEVAEIQVETLPAETATVVPEPQITPTEDRSDRLIGTISGYEIEVKSILFTPKTAWVTLCSLTPVEDMLQFTLDLKWNTYQPESQMVYLFTSQDQQAENSNPCSRVQISYGFDKVSYQPATYEVLPQDEDQYQVHLSGFTLNHTMDLNEEKCKTARQKLHQNNPDVDFTCADGIIQADISYPASMEVGTAWNLINESFMDHLDGEVSFTIQENAYQQVAFISQPEYELVSIQAEENPEHPFELVGVKGDEGYLQIGVCYQLPRQETLDWMFAYPVEVSDSQKTAANSSGRLIDYQNRGLEGTFRCEWIGFENFEIKSNEDFPDQLNLMIPAIQSPMPEGMGNCPDVQARLDADETGIKMECEVFIDPNGGGGGGRYIILEKPENMTEEEALNLVVLKYANENFEGPWNLTLQKVQ